MKGSGSAIWGAPEASKPTSRSELIRRAVKFYADQQERQQWEAKDAALYRQHGKRINRQVRATLQEQAELCSAARPG